MLIARLIADPAALETRLTQARAVLREEGRELHAKALHDCAGGTTFEITLEGGTHGEMRDLLDRYLQPVAALVSDAGFAVPQIFVSDMDSTMIGQECIDELADFAGLKHQIATITERAMQGELDFEQALRERVMLLRDLAEDAILECLNTRIKPMAGAPTLVATLKSKGCRTVLVTGGFHQFADPVAEWLGFDRVVGNRLAVANGALTGGLIGPITDSSVKKEVLLDEAGQVGGGAVSLATGDGANDIPMLEAATYGMAYHAKPKARAAANGYIDAGDLTAILCLLGIPEAEWVTP